MTRDTILDLFASHDTVAHFSLARCARPGSVGASAAMSLVGLSLVGRLKVDEPPDPAHYAHLDSLGMAPSWTGTEWPNPATYRRVCTVTPDEMPPASGQEVVNGIFDVDDGAFERILQRDFLLVENRHELPVVPAVLVREVVTWDTADVLAALGASREGGLLHRSDTSIQGDAIQVVSPGALGEVLRKGAGLLVRRYAQCEIERDLEVSISLDDSGVHVLGVTEQICRRYRHYGCRSVALDGAVAQEILDVAERLGSVLRRAGFRAGVVGLDGFVVRTPGARRFLAYDLNPCLSQAFFPLLLHRRLGRQLGVWGCFRTALVSLFYTPGGPLDLRWLDPTREVDGVFPMLVTQGVHEPASLRRLVTMVMAIGPDPHVLARWLDELSVRNAGRIVRSFEMYY